MKLLYGSQNFGFNLENSDRDWLKIVLPTWDDVLHNRSTSKTEHNPDGSLTKVVDIRVFNTHLTNGCFSDLQALWCVEQYNSEDLQWWIENRQRIAIMSLMDLYTSNSGCIRQMYKLGANPKNLTHMHVFNKLLHRVLETPEKFSIYVEDSREYRIAAMSLSEDKIQEAMDLLMKDTNNLKIEFEKYRQSKDIDIEQQMYDQTLKVVKKHLNKNLV